MATKKPYKPQRRRIGTIRYLEPNPEQTQGSYIYQFYRLNKKLIDAAYQGIGAANPYQHFKAEALDLIQEQISKKQPVNVRRAASYQLGKTSFVSAAGGNVYVNNILTMLRRTRSLQIVAHLAGYNKSSDINVDSFAGWAYDEALKQFIYTPISNRTGKAVQSDRAQRVYVWIQQLNRYPTGITVIHITAENGNSVEINYKGNDYGQGKKGK